MTQPPTVPQQQKTVAEIRRATPASIVRASRAACDDSERGKEIRILLAEAEHVESEILRLQAEQRDVWDRLWELLTHP